MMSPRDLSPNSGLAPRIIQQMLEGKARTQGQVEGDIVGDISLSIYDIYNKTVRDLVSGRQNLEKHLRETADGGWDFVERGTKASLLQVGLWVL